MEGSTSAHAVSRARAQAMARHVHHVQSAPQPRAAYAGLVTRVIAFALDAGTINLVALLVSVAVTLGLSVLPTSPRPGSQAVAIGGAVFALWVATYFVTFWVTTGQTPGSRLMQIRVERLDGTRLRPRQALVRLVGLVLSVPLFAGFLPILVTDRRRGLHDWMAGTVVVAAPPHGSGLRG